MELNKYSIGIGDRFGQQGKAQLEALFKAMERGITITPVWNKSFREHQIIGSSPVDTRHAADVAVQAKSWDQFYFVDADHIGLKTVAEFLSACDFFTMDVAEEIGKPVNDAVVQEFLHFCGRFTQSFTIAGIDEEIGVSPAIVKKITRRYLAGILEAEKIYQHIRMKKNQPFVLELSIDETEYPQQPVELFFILAAAAWRGLPLDTIAPKFTGRFNKGVDYVGDIEQFAREFEQNILVVNFAIREFNLPANLKLSVHSGSDKFSLYPLIRKILQKHDAGVHLKTAGTTWLEELIGIASVGGGGLKLAQEIYAGSFRRMEELTAPYATVLDIDIKKLPSIQQVEQWSAEQFVKSLRHVQDEPNYNPNLRQLLHVGYKVAAEMGSDFHNALVTFEDAIAQNVAENIFDRHIVPLFLD